MKPEELAILALSAIAAGTRMTLVFEQGKKRPPKFPRGELLCENHDGRNVYSFDPAKVLAWLHNNGLVQVGVQGNTETKDTKEAR